MNINIDKEKSQKFLDQINYHFSSKLDSKLLASLSILLVMDYINRIQEKCNIDKYVRNCINRLKKYLIGRNIKGNDFSLAMSLFIVAISNKKSNSKDNKKQAKIESVDAIIDSIFQGLSLTEREIFRIIISDLINAENGKDSLNLIMLNPKVFSAIVMHKANEVGTNLNKKILQHVISMNQIQELIQKINIATMRKAKFPRNITKGTHISKLVKNRIAKIQKEISR